MPPSVTLPDGRVAALEDDPFRRGCLVLTVDGAEQSLIDPHSPGSLHLEYTARLGAVVDAVAPAGEAVRILHLGGGALSLPRYAAWSRPGSRQTVVEAAVGLTSFVLAHAPLPAGADVQVIEGDAASSLPDAVFDLVVLDVYDGDEIPLAFYSGDVLARVVDRVDRGGLLAVNVADDADHRRLERLQRTLGTLLPVTDAVASVSFAEHRGAGNAILLASRGGGATAARTRLLTAGPHPVASVAQGHVVSVEVTVEVDP